MNLFQNTALIQALRDAFKLTIPQAQVVLMAHQHRTVSTQTVCQVFGYGPRELSGSHAISHPVRKKLLSPIGKARSPSNHKISTVYELTDREAIDRVISAAADKNVATFRFINDEEIYMQTELQELNHEDQ